MGVNNMSGTAVNTYIHSTKWKIEATRCSQSQSSGALPRGQASPQTTTTRLHAAHVTSTQHPTTRAVPDCASKAPAALHEATRLRATNRPLSQSIAIARARAAATDCPLA